MTDKQTDRRQTDRQTDTLTHRHPDRQKDSEGNDREREIRPLSCAWRDAGRRRASRTGRLQGGACGGAAARAGALHGPARATAADFRIDSPATLLQLTTCRQQAAQSTSYPPPLSSMLYSNTLPCIPSFHVRPTSASTLLPSVAALLHAWDSPALQPASPLVAALLPRAWALGPTSSPITCNHPSLPFIPSVLPPPARPAPLSITPLIAPPAKTRPQSSPHLRCRHSPPALAERPV